MKKEHILKILVVIVAIGGVEALDWLFLKQSDRPLLFLISIAAFIPCLIVGFIQIADRWDK